MNLGRERDSGGPAAHVEPAEVQHEPEQYHGLVLRLEQGGPAVLISRSGSFSTSGVENIRRLDDTLQVLEKAFTGLLGDLNCDIPLEARNLVHQDGLVDDAGEPGFTGLNSPSTALGTESIGHELERLSDPMSCLSGHDRLYLISGNGKQGLNRTFQPRDCARGHVDLHAANCRRARNHVVQAP